MSDVHVITYEVVGAGLDIASKFYAERDAAKDGQWEVVKSLGAEGYRPSYDGSIKSLLFKAEELPTGYRRIGRDKGRIECKPHKGTKAGKAALLALDAAPVMTPERELAELFGWEGRSPIDGRMIYHATAVRTFKPLPRIFIRLPRTGDDEWKMPSTLKEIPESEFMRAIEDHNAAVDATKRAA